MSEGRWIATPRSTSVRRFRYDATRRSLTIEFEGGGIYRYLAVPRVVFEELQAAPSKGRFVNVEIKRRYTSVKVFA